VFLENILPDLKMPPDIAFLGWIIHESNGK